MSVIHFERELAHPVDKVWAALTEPSELVGWLAEAEVDLRPGGQIVLRWLNSDDEGNQAVMHATITELDPMRVLEYAGDIHGTLRWELRPAGDGCHLTFSSTLEPPDEMLALVLAGWQIHLEHLADALDGRPVDWPRWDELHRPRWDELHARCVSEGAPAPPAARGRAEPAGR